VPHIRTCDDFPCAARGDAQRAAIGNFDSDNAHPDAFAKNEAHAIENADGRRKQARGTLVEASDLIQV